MADNSLAEADRRQLAVEAPAASSPARAPRKWRCLNCGQLVFTAASDMPPDVCQCCMDMTTWQAQGE